MSYQLKKAMREEFTAEIEKGYITAEEIRENSGEWIDGYLPVYNNMIIAEWQAMPGEYDDRGAEELNIGGDAGIIGRMSADLYLYYFDLFSEVMDEIEGDN
jgi:hypothetical protein